MATTRVGANATCVACNCAYVSGSTASLFKPPVVTRRIRKRPSAPGASPVVDCTTRRRLKWSGLADPLCPRPRRPSTRSPIRTGPRPGRRAVRQRPGSDSKPMDLYTYNLGTGTARICTTSATRASEDMGDPPPLPPPHLLLAAEHPHLTITPTRTILARRSIVGAGCLPAVDVAAHR